MKKVLKNAILIFLIIFLFGCGEPLNKSKMIKYANTNFKDAKLLNYNEDGEKNIATFIDKKYNFNYTVSSYMEEIYVDASYFGSHPSVSTDYYEKFVQYMKSSIKSELKFLKKKYNFSLKWPTYLKSSDDIYIELILQDDSEAKKVTMKVVNLLNKYDKKNTLGDAVISVMVDGKRVGKYSFKEKRYMTEFEIELESMKQSLILELSLKEGKIFKEENIKYLKNEVRDVNDIPGSENYKLSCMGKDTEENLDKAKVYYFKYKNDTWLVADCLTEAGSRYVSKLDA